MEWIKEGDRNTSFFHRQTSTHKKRNHIRKLWDKEGQWKYETTDIQGIISEYFSELFTLNRPNSDILELWLNRNRWLWDNRGLSPPDIVSRSRCLLSKFVEYCSSLKGPERNDAIRREW
ncbi:hypothetical protein Salat_2522300 [Sesamum alatum]|uniref:Uncharacterized protein n=1 Tax=Sesamum alatum TaxID=300844 RepID=A0AAE1XSW0_9LAMI|nr:hypothetical protein Salat_2522300 [Sesamum alatum]